MCEVGLCVYIYIFETDFTCREVTPSSTPKRQYIFEDEYHLSFAARNPMGYLNTNTMEKVGPFQKFPTNKKHEGRTG